MSTVNPTKIAILGAGPIGLEAALYARFLGYEVTLFEQGEVGQNISEWGHVKMFSPFSMNASSLGIAALTAQDEDFKPPEADDLLTGREYRERYLLPLSQSDLLSGHIQTRTKVIGIARAGSLKHEFVGHPSRGDAKFCLLTENEQGDEIYAEADIVIDSTGTWNQPRRLGPSGLPAIGERSLHNAIEYHIPDLCSPASNYEDCHTVVIGNGYSAATTVVSLLALTKDSPKTQISWVTRRPEIAPIGTIDNDPLSERRNLTSAANQAATESPRVNYLAGYSVSAIRETNSDQLEVCLNGTDEQTLQVDRIIANVGFKPDMTMLSELQLHKCYATDGPMKLAALLLSSATNDCMSQPETQSNSLITTEPNFYILGSKSYGRNSQFLIALGLTQIQELFTVIADRHDLNLYSTIGHSA
ncbi:MAG: NAD(P)-binding domain-containing protein [Planctomycetaceae bacterium]|nr:NAD(P)-binding domain-containing protein [Planctomycetaceae bacterium]